MNIVKSALNLFGISKDESVKGGAISLDDFLTGLSSRIGYDVEFTREQKDDGSHHIDVSGSDVGSFVGDNTQILDAIAHISMRVLRKQEGLSNKAVDEGTDLSKYRITVDAEGFREKHYENLKKVAEEAKDKVLQNSGRPAYIPALSPAERRVIHTHIAELGEVCSESIGNGTFKRIRIKLINDPGRAQRSAEAGARGPRQGGPSRGGRNFRPGRGPRDNFQNRGPRQENASGNSTNANVRKAHFDDYKDEGGEVNGNVVPPEETFEEIDDNIGNRVNSRDPKYKN
jgi:spoIIIJ-associated protein